MLANIVKKSAAELVYETLSAEGKLVKKTQSFNIMSLEAVDQDYYDLGKAIGDILAYSPKEILKNVVEALMEV